MNDLEKRSFYSFVGLYLGSSFLFILLLGYWYYNAQKSALESETYYKLEHLADRLGAAIINAQMKNTPLLLPQERDFNYTLIKTDAAQNYKVGYYEKEGKKILVSAAPQEHLSIKYVVVTTQSYLHKLHDLQTIVLSVMFVSFIFIGIIAFLLSKLFLKPIHNRMVQIEHFIQDISHELNTPITALKMSTSRALQKKDFDAKTVRNISISTKQLERIYKSLTFLNFEQQEKDPQEINLKQTIQQVILYYKELSDAKSIIITSRLEDRLIVMPTSRAELLISNLLSNAIKYSMPETTITIELTQEYLMVQDEGVGIASDTLETIFTIYKRQSHIAGGFGVGLHIVKQICDTYGMQISLTSTVGEGSCFTIHFKKSALL